MVDNHPQTTALRNDLAICLFNVASVQYRIGHPAKALGASDEAVSLWETLVRAEPRNPDYPGRLAAALGVSGRYRLDLHQLVAGRSDLRRAVEMLRNLPSPGAYDSYNLSCFYSVLSGTTPRPLTSAGAEAARADADRAIEAFRHSVRAGFADRSTAEKDVDLDPIRLRPEFQALLLDISFPAIPFV